MAVAGAVLFPPALHAAEVDLVVTGALVGAFRQLVPDYERSTGDKLVISWGPSAGASDRAIPVRVRNGERFDAVITSQSGLADLAASGAVDPQSGRDLVRSGIGVAVRNDAPVPDISSVAGLRQLLQDARSIGYSEGSSGVYIASALVDRLGLDAGVKGKFKKIIGEPVGEAVAKGEVEIGMQQISELRAVTTEHYVGPLPPEVQNYVVFSAGLSPHAANPAGAAAFLAFLKSAAAAPVLTASGLQVLTQ